MSAVTYEFYMQEYKGADIPTSAAFDHLLVQAQVLVDRMVINAAPLNIEAIRRRYMLAVCAVADCLYSQQQGGGGAVASESVGNHSVSYVSRSAADLHREQRKTAEMYLTGTGLLTGVLL